MTNEAEQRANYVKALGEMLSGLPPEEVVDSISLENNTRSDRRGTLRQGTMSWVVITVIAAGANGVRKTFWRGYLDRDTNTHKLGNVGFEYHMT
jgi:hypothetical protein